MEASEKEEHSSRRPWIRYRTELRHRVTGDLVSRTDSDKPHQSVLENEENQPIFELVTRYETVGSGLDQAQGALPGGTGDQSADSAPSNFLRIYSSAINNALRSVVQYYPSQDLSGSVIEIQWPYPILVHHYDALHKFKANCDAKVPDKLCILEKDASTHLTHLLTFLDDNIMERVRAEQERVKEGFHTFENQWIVHKPGDTVVNKNIRGQWRPMVVQSVSGGIYKKSIASWNVVGWNLQFDGRHLGRATQGIEITPFDGVASFRHNTVYLGDGKELEDKKLEELISYGEKYFRLLTRQCRYHKGETVVHPYNEVKLSLFLVSTFVHGSDSDVDGQVDGLAMSDLETFYATNQANPPTLLEDNDCRKFYSDCTCSVCQERAVAGKGDVKSVFKDYNNIVPREIDQLSRHMYLLCPSQILAYVFKLRSWCRSCCGQSYSKPWRLLM